MDFSTSSQRDAATRPQPEFVPLSCEEVKRDCQKAIERLTRQHERIEQLAQDALEKYPLL